MRVARSSLVSFLLLPSLSFVVFLVTDSAARSDTIIFSDNPGRGPACATAWGYCKASSHVELASVKKRQGKMPVDREHRYRGLNSIRMRWTSRSGGDWGVAIAAPQWKTFDATAFSSITFRVNGPAAIPAYALPDLSLEDESRHESTRVPLARYLDGLDDDLSTWQEVAVPLAFFAPGKKRCDFTKVVTVYFHQHATDSVERVVWIDDLRAKDADISSLPVPPVPRDLTACGYDSRIDLFWQRAADSNVVGYNVYRADSPDGPFDPVNPYVHERSLYSDFFGENGCTYFYRVTSVNTDSEESDPSAVVSATSCQMTEDELLTSVQESAFRYFYDYGHPISGLARERTGSGKRVTIGGSGFGLLTIMVGVERGFVSRDAALERVLKITRFLEEKAQRYHGAWSHWLNGGTGATIPFSSYDDGGDLVETAFMVEALLTLRQYFDRDTEFERELRARATRLWEGVEWDWYRQRDSLDRLYWHWSPNHGWRRDLPIRGFNECMIVYILAVASPTHPVPPELYYRGWAADGGYANGLEYYGHTVDVGREYGGPLFFTHYSFMGFDPRGWRDGFCNYFENNRNIALVHQAYCAENPRGFKDYSALVWGLTASDNPWGYAAHSPENDNGTISPTAAISSMPYVPEEAMATLRYFYYHYGPDLWGEFGFRDAFNPTENWFSENVLAIDQGPIAPMIENYRSGLCWKYFMANEEIPRALRAIGWQEMSQADEPME
ncbi:MAG: glucoamylase family protein [bacterium]